MTCPAGRPHASAANTRVRTAIGYLSATSDGEIGIRAAPPRPEPTRARPIWNELATAPVSTANTPHRPVAAASTLVRL